MILQASCSTQLPCAVELPQLNISIVELADNKTMVWLRLKTENTSMADDSPLF